VETLEMSLEFWRNKKVLLTGHTGFKGSWLSLWLQELGAKLVGYSLSPPTQPSLFTLAQVEEGMRSVHGDVLDLAHLRQVVNEFQPEVILHLAAQSLVPESYINPIGTFATNVMGTVHLLEVVRDVPSVRGVIVVSSDKCYENLEGDSAYRETDRLGGNDPYSSSKACVELLTCAYRRSFFSSDARMPNPGIASVRAGNVIGGGDWASDRLIPDAMRSAVQEKELCVRNPDAVRPWQHVLEPLRGYLMLAEKLYASPREFSGAWNFGPEQSDVVPVREILNRLQQLWGGGPRWHPDRGVPVHEAQYLRLDCAKARKELHWEPCWRLDSALRSTVEWYKAHQGGKNLRQVTRQQIEAYQSQMKRTEIAR
jgi:CDP-glucose 4,6-dehydratase